MDYSYSSIYNTDPYQQVYSQISEHCLNNSKSAKMA